MDYIKETVNISIPKKGSQDSYLQQSESSPLLGTNQKFRFPMITNTQLRQALENNFLTHEQKETLVRNPNALTILRAQFNLDSPRTLEAMHQLEIEEDDLPVIDYKMFFDPKKDPLFNLVQYLLYLTDQYHVRQEVLKRRNQLKKQHFQPNHHQSQQINHHNVLLTETPETANRNHKSQEVSYSGLLTFQNKKEQFDKKLQKEQQNFSKFMDMALSQMSKQEEYYGKTAPQLQEKIDKQKQKQLDTIKKKLKKKNIKVEQICQKIKDQEKNHYEEHSQIIENMEKSIVDHQERKKKLLLQSQDNLIEQLKRKEDKDKERQMKRQISIQNEERMINQVIEQIQKKSEYLNSYLHKKQIEEKQKHQQNLKVFEEKQQKLQDHYSEIEKQRVQEYISKSAQRQEQLFKHELLQQKHNKALSLKNSRVMKKIETIQEQSVMKQQQSMIKSIENDDKLMNGIKRHQSLIDLRKSNISANNETRFGKVKKKKMEQMLHKIHQQDKMLEKTSEQNKKINKQKQELIELEKYKIQQLQGFTQQKSLLLNKYQSI